jgi:hypothetical protein
MPEHQETLILPHIIAAALSQSCSATPGTGWNERQSIAYESLSRRLAEHNGSEVKREDVFLGGDSLRPYLAVRAEHEAWVVSKPLSPLSPPSLLMEVASGKFGAAQRSVIELPPEEYLAWSLFPGGPLMNRLVVPNVYLVSLTNASRYQTRRYPLNVGRLAQWLRFQHAGRVTVADLALDFDGDLRSLSDDVVSSNPDILGISLNFGELDSLRTLISSLRDSSLHPSICLGNVLAAWAPDEVAEICAGFNVRISYSYGEADLERECRLFGERVLGRADLHLLDDKLLRAVVFPTAIVMPDERLLATTLRQGGQVSIETSFGCQYGRCSFCPRDHRGKGWLRPDDASAVVEGMASLVDTIGGNPSGVLSIVDEDAFGEEGINPGGKQPSIVNLVTLAGSHNLACEIYTRLEQLFDRGRGPAESMERLEQLLLMRPSLVRVFVGVESGSESQLRRYAKGQSVQEVVDALRAGALLGLPLEFGFITFDPLLVEHELIENLEFLARTDVLLSPRSDQTVEDVYSLVISEQSAAPLAGDPVFTRVAYMATELELFANSAFLKRLLKTHPQLVGERDNSFARYNYCYDDQVVGRVAAWCRVWTEGTFRPIYRMRLAGRTLRGAANPYQEVIRRYRDATFGLLVALTGRFSLAFRPRATALLAALGARLPLDLNNDQIHLDELNKLWQWIVSAAGHASVTEEAVFSLESLERRRAA